MISLKFFRGANARRLLAVWGAVSVALVPIGCADRSTNSDGHRPLAVTQGGVEITGVARDTAKRTVSATIVAAGIERHVTMAPLLDGPLSSGFTAALASSNGDAIFELAYAWDVQTGEVWVRQRNATDAMEFSRQKVYDRAHETYDLNGNVVALEYADLSDAQLDKAVARWKQDGLSTATSPDLVEMRGVLQNYRAFDTAYRASSLYANEDGALLVSLLDDPEFVTTVMGVDEVYSNATRNLCGYLAACSALFCRLVPTSPVCLYCGAGVMACAFLDVFCDIFGCDCCY